MRIAVLADVHGNLPALRAVLSDLDRDPVEAIVVGGHTHQQMIRRVTDRLTYANAGSVGMPYEGRPGAFWLIVDDGVPELRETGYGLEVAWDELSRSGYPDLEELLLESLREPVDPARVTDFFEGLASRSLRGPSA